jgi:hypothetical protein
MFLVFYFFSHSFMVQERRIAGENAFRPLLLTALCFFDARNRMGAREGPEKGSARGEKTMKQGKAFCVNFWLFHVSSKL